jgi:hypothetical protein
MNPRKSYAFYLTQKAMWYEYYSVTRISNQRGNLCAETHAGLIKQGNS